MDLTPEEVEFLRRAVSYWHWDRGPWDTQGPWYALARRIDRKLNLNLDNDTIAEGR